MVVVEKLTASQENYLESIYHLIQDNKDGNTARPIDISKKLGVGKSSVSEALRVLADKKLINYSPYGAITLTFEGENKAQEVVLKHEVLYNFFTDILGLERDEAIENACKIEHVISENALKKLLDFVEFSEEFYCKNTTITKEFEEFCRNKDKNK